MKRPAEDGEEPPAKKPRTLPPIGEVADGEEHVFISLQGYADKVGTLFDGGHRVVFIRGGVAIGKTTLAEHLAARFPEEYVNVPFTEHGTADAWRASTVEAVQKETGRVDGDGSAFRNALRRAKEKNLTLIYDEAHTIFRSPDLCSDLFKTSGHYRPRVLLFSASGEASTTAPQFAVATPSEITQKFMWTPPLPGTPELKGQLEESGVRLDEKSIEFFALFCGGHRGIFIAAMHWVKSKQAGESWGFSQTVGFVRKSYDKGDWDTGTGILAFVGRSRAVHVNGKYSSVGNTPQEFAEVLCKGASRIATLEVRKELAINGFVLPKHDRCIEGEFQQLDWNNEGTEYQVANPVLASYYRYNLKKHCSLEVQFEPSNPQRCADLLMRAIPYLPFSKVVSFEGETSELAKDSLPHETQYNQAFHSVLPTMRYQTFAPQSSKEGEGKPDLRVHIGEESFAIEGMKQNIEEHLRRFNIMVNYKNAKHQGLCIIGNDSEKMLETLKKH
ncbi:unnamed protein product [Effrenium voratum]|nr:unnamed protein product [Effrenium voratum]